MVLLRNDEIEFASGETFSETQRMRLTYRRRAGMKFPVIYCTAGNEKVRSLELTDSEARWLRDELTRMFPKR